MKATEPSPNDILLRLKHALLSGAVEQPDYGEHTRQWWSEAWGKSRTQTKELLARSVAAGLMTRRMRRIAVNGVVQPVPHYAPTEVTLTRW